MPNKTIVISVVSTKGGVGKTTFVANLSGLLAALKLRVLVQFEHNYQQRSEVRVV